MMKIVGRIGKVIGKSGMMKKKKVGKVKNDVDDDVDD